MTDSMEDLEYAVERSDAETPDDLIEYANSLYLGNPAHDALTQVCFSCEKVRTNMEEEEI